MKGDPKTVTDRLSDWFYEASVLVGALGWLDRAVKGDPFSGTWAIEILLGSAALFGLGMALDRIRHSN